MPDNYTKERAVIEYIILCLADMDRWAVEKQLHGSHANHTLMDKHSPLRVDVWELLGFAGRYTTVHVSVDGKLLPSTPVDLEQAVLALVSKVKEQEKAKEALLRLEKNNAVVNSIYDTLLGNR